MMTDSKTKKKQTKKLKKLALSFDFSLFSREAVCGCGREVGFDFSNVNQIVNRKDGKSKTNQTEPNQTNKQKQTKPNQTKQTNKQNNQTKKHGIVVSSCVAPQDREARSVQSWPPHRQTNGQRGS
jgi:hypothetical protein